MQTIKSNTDSFGNGLISVGNTTRSSAASRIQKDVDAIGWLGADLQVVGITDLRSFSPEEQRVVPDWLTMYEKTMDGPECRTSDDRRAESLTWYYERQHCPINHTTSAVLFMSYQQDGDRIVIDDAARNAYWGVMKYDEANKAGLFINADAPIIYNPAKADRPLNRYRDRELLALWDRTSDLVLPARCATGSGIRGWALICPSWTKRACRISSADTRNASTNRQTTRPSSARLTNARPNLPTSSRTTSISGSIPTHI